MVYDRLSKRQSRPIFGLSSFFCISSMMNLWGIFLLPTNHPLTNFERTMWHWRWLSGQLTPRSTISSWMSSFALQMSKCSSFLFILFTCCPDYRMQLLQLGFIPLLPGATDIADWSPNCSHPSHRSHSHCPNIPPDWSQSINTYIPHLGLTSESLPLFLCTEEILTTLFGQMTIKAINNASISIVLGSTTPFSSHHSTTRPSSIRKTLAT